MLLITEQKCNQTRLNPMVYLWDMVDVVNVILCIPITNMSLHFLQSKDILSFYQYLFADTRILIKLLIPIIGM